MNCRKALEVAALIAATGLTRFAFRSRYLYDIDSVNFALALRRFDPGAHQPHPPGYFLYVCLGRVADTILHDANNALVSIGIVFSCGAVAMVYWLADEWFGSGAAPFAGLIFLFSPLAWFHGTVALTYIVEAFFSALVGYLCWRVEGGAARWILPAAVVLGIATGFRPSTILFLGPLFLFSLRNACYRQIAAATGALTVTMLAWFIPMVRIVGANAWVSSLASLWLAVPSKESIFNSSALNSVARAGVIVCIYFLCFGCAAILPLLRIRDNGIRNGGIRDNGIRNNSVHVRDKTVFTRVWIAPGLLFFTFVYLKFVNSGYLLILTPPVCAWLGLWASLWYANLRLSNVLKPVAAGCCVAINTMIFVYAPVYCSYGELRRFEKELRSIVGVLPEIAPARETMIVGLDSHFLGYRHAGYYLPQYLTVQFPEVELGSGMRVFAMRGDDTRLLSRPESSLATASIRNFIIFPLPLNDSEYGDYMAVLRRRFPAGDLRLIARAGHEFAIGPVADLRFLFPAAASPDDPAVRGR